MKRNLSNTNTGDAKESTSDIEVKGNPDLWRLICKASSASQGWMKSTKGMELAGGVLIQVTTEHRDKKGKVTACAEALQYVPACSISDLV